tara:strand:- start:1163 stop:1507 length:345 start_codon:yes stop_codon:yes gene_type:complete
MLVLQFLLALGLAMLAHARMSTEFVTHAVDVFEIMDFLVFNVVSTELRDPATRVTNRTISCMFTLLATTMKMTDIALVTFADPNANTTIKCGEAWTNDNTPFNYVYCGNGPNAK